MKTSLKTALFLIVFGLVLISVNPVKAQCSQCAATIESNSKNGGTAANGLNHGILFLLAAPYIAAGAIGFLWYKKYRRRNVSINISNKKLDLN